MNDKKYFAVYSAQQARRFGIVFWRGVNGEDIELSQISNLPDMSDVLWPDKEFRGEVVTYLGRGRETSSFLRRREAV